MKPAPFLYCAPTCLDEALSLLAEHGAEAKVLAGGQSLMPAMSMRLLRPAVLIDVNRIPELAYVRDDGQALVLGAMTRQRVLEESLVARRLPLLKEAAQWIGSFQVRNRGTIGGSLAYGDPAAELPAVALALDAELLIAGAGEQRRTLHPASFYLGPLRTALRPDELLLAARFPVLPAGAGWSVQEMTQRCRAGMALAGVVAVVSWDAHGRCADARLVLYGVADRPLRVVRAESVLRGQMLSEPVIAAAAAEVTTGLESFTDLYATADYRRTVAGVLVRRVLVDLARRQPLIQAAATV